MNAQSKTLNQLAAAILMAMAVSTVWAENNITFEQAPVSGTAYGNGINNAAVIDADEANGATVNIFQVNKESLIVDSLSGSESTAGNLGRANQVGNETTSFVVKNDATIQIGQGVGFKKVLEAYQFDDTTVSGTKGNLVKGTVSGGTLNISQINSATADDGDAVLTTNTVNIVSMTSGELTANQRGTNQTLTVTSYVDALDAAETKTVVNQAQGADNSTLTLVNAGTTNGYNMTVNQNGAYQQTSITYTNGYTGNVILNNRGEDGTPATLDLHL